jgi:enolase
MATVKAIRSRQVLDSRGRPTVEVDVIASDGALGRAIVPSGASTGRHEALELRDRERTAYGGLGVRQAVAHVEGEIASALIGRDLEDQAGIDATLIALDGTPNKGRLGANAILGVSLSVAHAAAASRGEELFERLNRLWRDRMAAEKSRKGAGDSAPALSSMLPLPMVNMISGGLHAGRNLDIQDVLMIPVGAASYSEALEMTVALYRALGAVLKDLGLESSLVGDEGGYGPKLRSNEEALERVVDAIGACGLKPGADVAIALDVASSHFFDPETRTYRLSSAGDAVLDSGQMVDLLSGWVDRFPIVSIEDGLAEDDWVGWKRLTERLGSRIQLIGDDLFTTSVDRLRHGAEQGAGNAILIKVNQIGTLSETLDALATARTLGYRAIVSARSGETEDATIADLAVATGAGQIKIGSVVRSERLAKYNRLLRIEETLGPAAPYAGRAALSSPL